MMVLTTRYIGYYAPQTRQKYHRNTLRWPSRPTALYYKCNTAQYKCKLAYYKCILTYYKSETQLYKCNIRSRQGATGGQQAGRHRVQLAGGRHRGASCRALRGEGCCGPAGCWLLRPCGDKTEVTAALRTWVRAWLRRFQPQQPAASRVRPQLPSPRKMGPCCLTPCSLAPPCLLHPVHWRPACCHPVHWRPACCHPHIQRNSLTKCKAVESFRPLGGVFLRSSEVARDSEVTPLPWVERFRQLLQYRFLITFLYFIVVRLLNPSQQKHLVG